MNAQALTSPAVLVAHAHREDGERDLSIGEEPGIVCSGDLSGLMADVGAFLGGGCQE